ncbi:MAG TPA: hypothetical protein VK430_01600 [Xanthobacteraceae bacterium]|nr:hypothetical protein [Xanthobacteraceae bacterium]
MKAIRELWRTFEDVFDPYRPELYYMRGPGPKCRAKRADSVTSAMPAAEVATDFSKVRA